MKAPRQRLSSEERQDHIVAAALRLAADRSVDRITTEDMASEIGLTQGAIFRHFPTKESIWSAVVEAVGTRLMKTVDDALADAPDALAGLERIFHGHVGLMARFPAMPRILFHELQSDKDSRPKQLVRGIMSRYRERLMSLLAEAKVAGLARSDLDEEAAANMYIGAVQGLIMQAAIVGRYKDLPEKARRLFPLYLNAVRGGERGAVRDAARKSARGRGVEP